mmetsp:Transcript_33028/g.32167  ORF Transcript_33028/g.32167 Transcript_33028/m.32167 type:complete len:99 (-) Transcript_33028:425-721(-)
MKKVMQIRQEYPVEKSINVRKALAKEELDAWVNYLEERKQDLSKDYQIEPKVNALLKENFDRFKDRKTHQLPSKEMVDFHYDFAKKFKLAVPLHPRNL